MYLAFTLLVGALVAFVDPGAVPAALAILLSGRLVYLVLED